jgi:murein L,D-transpeptidase YcbB/YkuD
MKSTSTILFVAACMGSCLILVFSGCGGPQIYPAEANRPSQPSQRPTALGETQLALFLTKISQLQMAAQESLDAATLIGTPEHELLAAKQDYVSAEQLLQDGNAAYGAKQYVQSWDKLQAADAAFRRAEETAVLAGLGQLERELVSDYGRLLNSEARGSRRSTSAARVSQGSAILRNGAGTDFQVIGKAQLGDTLSILAESGEWYRVRTGTGLIGWVSKLSVTKIRNL